MLVRHLCADTYPEAQQSRWFRRNNRGSIQRSVMEVLYRAWHMRCRLEASGSHEAVDFIDPCFEPQMDCQDALLFAAEAEEKINRAVRLDCGSFDC
jgi:hypothetical protein